VVGGSVNEFLGAGEIEGDWFFYEDVQPGLEQRATDFGMSDGRDGDYARVRILTKGSQAGKGAYAELFGGSFGVRCIEVVDASEVCLQEFFEDSNVVATESAGSCHCDTD